MPGDTVIFMTRLHKMEQCKTKVNKETMLMLRLMVEEVGVNVMNVLGMVRGLRSRAENL